MGNRPSPNMYVSMYSWLAGDVPAILIRGHLSLVNSWKGKKHLVLKSYPVRIPRWGGPPKPRKTAISGLGAAQGKTTDPTLLGTRKTSRDPSWVFGVMRSMYGPCMVQVSKFPVGWDLYCWRSPRTFQFWSLNHPKKVTSRIARCTCYMGIFHLGVAITL